MGHCNQGVGGGTRPSDQAEAISTQARFGQYRQRIDLGEEDLDLELYLVTRHIEGGYAKTICFFIKSNLHS